MNRVARRFCGPATPFAGCPASGVAGPQLTALAGVNQAGHLAIMADEL